MRIGSRSNNPLTAALLAAEAGGALTLPPVMAEGRSRLVAAQVALSELQAPQAEQVARTAAVRALVADPASDVVGAIIAAREADAAHALRAELLREALDLAADEADYAGPDLWSGHVQPAFDDCVNQLNTAYGTFSAVSVDPDQLWGESKKIRDAWSTFTRAASRYELLRNVWRASRAGSPALLDGEGLFDEVMNLGTIWPERLEGLRPVSVMVPPWPRRVDALEWMLWMIGHGAVLHMPSAEQQDSAWSAAFGERHREFAAGGRHRADERAADRLSPGGRRCSPTPAPTEHDPHDHPPSQPRKDCAVIDADVHWTATAACADDDRFTGDDVSEPLVEALQAVCRACPVTVRCNAYALEVEAAWGMWAGVWRTPQTLAASRQTAA